MISMDKISVVLPIVQSVMHHLMGYGVLRNASLGDSVTVQAS